MFLKLFLCFYLCFVKFSIQSIIGTDIDNSSSRYASENNGGILVNSPENIVNFLVSLCPSMDLCLSREEILMNSRQDVSPFSLTRNNLEIPNNNNSQERNKRERTILPLEKESSTLSRISNRKRITNNPPFNDTTSFRVNSISQTNINNKRNEFQVERDSTRGKSAFSAFSRKRDYRDCDYDYDYSSLIEEEEENYSSYDLSSDVGIDSSSSIGSDSNDSDDEKKKDGYLLSSSTNSHQINRKSSQKEEYQSENESNDSSLSPTKEPIVVSNKMKMMKKFKDYLINHSDPGICRNIYCGARIKIGRGKHICNLCADFFRKNGELRGKDKKIRRKTPVSPVPITKGPTRNDRKNKMLIEFKDDLESDPANPRQCYNKYCKNEIRKNRGKYFCCACCGFYARNGELRGKSNEPIKGKKKKKSPSQSRLLDTYCLNNGKNYNSSEIKEMERAAVILNDLYRDSKEKAIRQEGTMAR